jgi:hypothetical protein
MFQVNSDMLLNIVTLEDDVLVFFYDPEDKDSEDILNELETIDDNLDEEEVEFVKCSEPNAQREYGLTQVPALVFFENGVPEVRRHLSAGRHMPPGVPRGPQE